MGHPAFFAGVAKTMVGQHQMQAFPSTFGGRNVAVAIAIRAESDP
jgi:hypothetical protein